MTPKQLSARRSQLRRKYGITLEQYEELFERQDGRCFVCEKPQSAFKTRLAVDHNHETGEIRGLLCFNCNNRIIGRHKEPRILQRAAEYLSQKGTGWFVPPKQKRKRRKRR